MPATSTAPAPIDRSLVRALRARLEAETGAPVALKETHISWVLLTASQAYKLKRPVRLPFLDFSTPAARRHFCEEELRLNRRLAPELYLEVVPVCGTPQAPVLRGEGEPIDHAVCMRRFPEEDQLDRRLAAGELVPADVDRLAQRLAAFHRAAPAAPPASPWGMPEQVLQPVLDVLMQLQAGCGTERLVKLRGWIGEQARALRPAWLARRREGHVRECHGDLHLANAVKLGDEVTAFDCIEFDPALRWIDVMGDVAFMTMDLHAHECSGLAWRFLDAWLQHSGDHAGLRVLRFYEVYRALVRGLVGRLRSAEPGAPSCEPGPDYLGCALRLVHDEQRARLLITCGVSGSGKSTLAAQLLEAAGAIRLRSDVERKRLFGLDALQSSAGHVTDIYTPEATRRTFDHLADRARDALASGYPVIVDAAFLRRDERLRFRALAAELGVPFTILHCRAAEAELASRVATRAEAGMDASEATVEVLQRQLGFAEPLGEEERALAIEVVTDRPVAVIELCTRWLAQASLER